MLISYPFLVGTDLKEAQDMPEAKEDEARGLFPITTREGWHGGLHLVHTLKPDGVRAIADGTVIAYRMPTPMPTNEADRDAHVLGFNGWTDDGFVLMKHEKECGEGRPVVFYSLYMHLSEITHEDLQKLKAGNGELKVSPKKQAKVGGKIKEKPIVINRKASFATPGSINGLKNRIHFEIFTDSASLDAFIKPDGASRDPWGNLYFKIPKGTVYVRDPKANRTDGTLAENMLLEVRFTDGARIVTWLNEETGEELMAPRAFPGVENNLYQAAGAMGNGTLCRGYEMARFGRLMEWNDVANDPAPATPRCWIELPTGGYVDVAPAGITKLSDMDFPAWKWKKLEATPLLDVATGTWKLPDLITEVDANGDGTLTVAEAEGWLKAEANRMALRRLVVKAQSEWDGDKAEERWGYIKKLMAKDPEAKRAALKRKLAWLEAQRTQAETALPKLEARLKDWVTRLDSLNNDRDKAKSDAQAAKEREKEAEASLKALRAKTKAEIQTMGKQAWKDQVKEREEALAEVQRERQRAEAQVEQDERAIAQAEVWKRRDTQREVAAKDLIASEPTRKQALENDLKVLEGVTVKEEDQKAADEAFEKFKAHIAALQWWKEVQGQVKDFPASTDVWHFHPLNFIEQMKKCHWLSEGELEAIYPETPESIRKKYRMALNRVMWKYGITSRLRQTHFLGQGWVESSYGNGALTGMREMSTVFATESLAEENGEYYQNPQDFYYTHIQHYDGILGNIDKEELQNSQGGAADIDAAVKKSNEELEKEIAKAAKEKEDLDARIKQLKAKTPKDEKALKELQVELQTKMAELENLKKSKKHPGTRYRQVAEQTIDASKSTCGDGMKFRGRGMKQLTGRCNYVKYWCYRGWLQRSDFDDPWWQGLNHAQVSNGKRAPQITNPQRACENAFNCIDTGGWFWEAGSRQPINSLIQESQGVEDAILNVSIAINGKNRDGVPNGLGPRTTCTKKVAEVTLDKVE